MSIKRYNSTKDNTIANALRENLSARSTKANMGASDILELFSIYGQASSSSVEHTRILLQFPIDSIASDRTSGKIPESGSIKFKLKMCNTPHGQTTPENYTVNVHPLVRSWNEGDGLDMESYLDLEASNWVSASSGVTWHTTGSDFVSSSYVRLVNIPLEYSQAFESGTEDVEIDITPWTEEWLKTQAGSGVAAVGSVQFLDVPSVNDTLTIHSHEGKKVTYTFINTATYTVGNDVFLKMSASAADVAKDIDRRISSDFDSKITSSRNSATLTLTQTVGGFHGNTNIATTMTDSEATITQFAGGVGLPNYGLVLKLKNDFEDGSKKRSYYTKKFYSRSSHEFFLKPKIEAQWDDSIKDDRNSIIKSSSLAPQADNLNNIFLYNRIRGNLVDIPSTASHLVVQLFTSSVDASDSGTGEHYGTAQTLPVDHTNVVAGAATFITASKHSTGVYKAQFSYAGSETQLYDVWAKSGNDADGGRTTLFKGPGFTVGTDSANTFYESPNYKVSITNLKDSYIQTEKTTLRVYTRNKNWQPNIYTVAKNTAPVNTIRDLYYKVVKVSDNYEVISYSTGSTPSYSSVSYDVSGSFFDLDMTLLEKNNAYEISFVFKDGANYIEQQEKFRFRVDP
tara:strand:- start:5727 stop:7601 length:1875 start_codon:yes stop_codon:yes gene_type:complete